MSEGDKIIAHDTEVRRVMNEQNIGWHEAELVVDASDRLNARLLALGFDRSKGY